MAVLVSFFIFVFSFGWRVRARWGKVSAFDEKCAHRKTVWCRVALTPGRECWPEVMIFLDDFLRRGSPCPEESVSSDEQGAHRKTVVHRRLNSGERMLAGGELVFGQPNSGEAAVVGGDDLFGCSPPAKDPSRNWHGLPAYQLPSPSQIESGFFRFRLYIC